MPELASRRSSRAVIPTRRKKRTVRSTTKLALRYLGLSVVAAVFLAPFIWMVSGSLKSDAEFKAFPPTLFGKEIRWDNYARVFELQPFAQQYMNSVFVLVSVCALTVVIAAGAGYAFARTSMRGGNLVFLVLLSGMFIPIEATILPLYRMVVALGWVDTLIPLIVISGAVTATPIAAFIMRQAFASLPPEFGEAALVDGAGRWRTFAQIYLPMVTPSIAAVVIYTAWLSWNQFLEPLLFLRSSEMLTVPVALTHFEDMAGPLWGVQAAAATMSVVPVILIFLFAQKQVVSGLTEGGIK